MRYRFHLLDTAGLGLPSEISCADDALSSSWFEPNSGPEGRGPGQSAHFGAENLANFNHDGSVVSLAHVRTARMRRPATDCLKQRGPFVDPNSAQECKLSVMGCASMLVPCSHPDVTLADIIVVLKHLPLP